MITLALTILLLGPVVVEGDVAVAQAIGGRLAYVQRGECLLGAGTLHLSDTAGNGSDLATVYTLRGTSPASVAAAVLCNAFNHGVTQ